MSVTLLNISLHTHKNLSNIDRKLTRTPLAWTADINWTVGNQIAPGYNSRDGLQQLIEKIYL